METQEEPIVITIGSDHKLRIFRSNGMVLLLFIQEHNGRHLVCWAIGDTSKTPTGRTYELMADVPSRAEAEECLESVSKLLGEHLGPAETDYIVKAKLKSSNPN